MNFCNCGEVINKLANNLLDILQVDYYKLDVYTRMKIEECLSDADDELFDEFEETRENSYDEGWEDCESGSDRKCFVTKKELW